MTTVRHLEDGDRERVAHMQRQAFVLPPERAAIAGRYPAEQGWVVEDGGVVHGALRVQKLGQFFGGAPVPCAAVSSVKVAAESRGRGYGGALVGRVLSALREERVAVSTLFPVHLGVYRAYGWEAALACQRRRLLLAEAVVRSHDGGGFRIEPWEDADLPEVAEFYRDRVQGENGPFDRSNEWWHERVLAPVEHRVPYRYVARSDDGIGGYVVYTHLPADGDLPYGFELDCRDLYWSSPEAAAAIFAFARSHGGMGHALRWLGPVSDPLEQVLSGLAPSTIKRLVAMCRIVDVGRALESRGYPADLEGTLCLRVLDDVLPENDGTYEVSFAGGRAAVAPGAADPDLTVDVRTLAPLFTGWLDPERAAAHGMIEASGPGALGLVRRAFGGPTPWMAGFF